MPYVLSPSLLALWGYSSSSSTISSSSLVIDSSSEINVSLSTNQQCSIHGDVIISKASINSSSSSSSSSSHGIEVINSSSCTDEMRRYKKQRLSTDEHDHHHPYSTDHHPTTTMHGIIHGWLPSIEQADQVMDRIRTAGQVINLNQRLSTIDGSSFKRASHDVFCDMNLHHHSSIHTSSSSSLSSSSSISSSISIASLPSPLLVASIDCEMCDTINGLELTRLTIIDIHSSIILDTYVKPDLPIINYRSEYSGITSEILDSVTVTLKQVQVAFLRLISSDTILIGHSLDSDLRALQIDHHSRCIDTAVLYPHPRGYPLRFKLKKLALDYLQLHIQGNNKLGMSLIHLLVFDIKYVKMCFLIIYIMPLYAHHHRLIVCTNSIFHILQYVYDSYAFDSYVYNLPVVVSRYQIFQGVVDIIL